MYPKIYINRNNMFLQEEVMFCKKCGTQINDGARFCVSCGTAVEMPAAPEAPAYQPAPAAPAYQPAPAAPAYQAPAAPQQYYAPAPAAPKKKIEFITTLLVVIVLAALWTVFTVVGLSGENGYLEGHGIEMQIIYFCIYAGVAAVAVMTVRTKGLDLSLPGVIGVASVIITETDTLFGGLIAAIMVVALIGAINGALVTFLKAPTVVTTFIVGELASFIAYAAEGGSGTGEDLSWAGALGLMVLIVGGAFLINLFLVPDGKTGWRGAKVRNIKTFLVYVASAVVSAFIALLWTLQRGEGSPYIGSDAGMIMIFAAAAVLSARFANNKFLAMAGAGIAAVVWTVIDIGLLFADADYATTSIIEIIVAIGMLVVSMIVLNKEKKLEEIK